MSMELVDTFVNTMGGGLTHSARTLNGRCAISQSMIQRRPPPRRTLGSGSPPLVESWGLSKKYYF
jgi:hypothetical protein